jgi:uncharacterized RDD family membrane protein YckC
LHSTDKLTIQTPEQVALELPLAGIGSRSIAALIDSIFQVIVIVLIYLTYRGLKLAFPVNSLFPVIGEAIAIILFFIVFWGYFMLFEIWWNGQTPGKRIVGIRVIKDSGRPVTAAESIGRNLVRIIDFIPLYGTGLICMILNQRNKRLGDYVAGTLLIHDKPVGRISPIWNPDRVSTTTDSQAAKIPPEMLVLIETYLNRRDSLEAAVRRKTAKQIVSMIKDKTGIERTEEGSDDAFIESVARKVRDTARYR